MILHNFQRNRRHLIRSGEAFEPDASDASILSSSEPMMSPSIPATISQSSQANSEPPLEVEHSEYTTTPIPYITRFGRTVKPKVIVSV